MSARRAVALLALSLPLWSAPSARADKLDKDSKKWLEEIAALILPEEEKVLKDLKNKGDREEFQKIFWARRNPRGPAALENPAAADFQKAKTEADAKFAPYGKPGAGTDCGKIFVLLGEPAEQKQDLTGAAAGRPSQTWIYRDKPGFSFKGGEMEIQFDVHCRLPEGSRFLEEVAKSRVVDPNIEYKVAKDGRLTPLEDLLPKPTPVQALLKEPREDFPLTAQTKLVMSGKDGATYVAGLVHVDATHLAVQDEAGQKRAAVVVAARAEDETGKVVAVTPDRETTVDVVGGAVEVSYGLTLKPGKYSVRVAVHDPKGGKGSASTLPIEAPDFSDGLTASELMVISDIRQHATQDAREPMAAFYLGNNQLVPRYGNTFSKTEALQVLAFVYNGKTDPGTGKADLVAKFTIRKDGRPLSTSEDQPFDEPMAAPGVGPVPLESFTPGKYVVQLSVKDKVANAEITKEAPFEVVP